MPRVLPVASLAIVLCAAPALAADPPPIITARLEYEAAQGCPAVSVLRAEFARRQGHDPFVDVAPLRVVATIAREKGTLAGSVKLYDSADQLLWSRVTTTSATDCQAIVQEIAGKLAVRLDPLAYPPSPPSPKLSSDPPPSTKLSSDPPPPPKPKLKPNVDPPQPETIAPAPWRAVVGVGPQVVIRAATAFGLVGHLGLRWPAFSPGMGISLGMEMRYDGPSSVAVDDPPGASVQTFFVGGSLVSCLHGVHLFGCAVGTGGLVSIKSTGFDDSRRRLALGLVGTGVRLGYEQEIRPGLAFRIYGEALVSARPLQGKLDGAEFYAPALSFPVSGVAGATFVLYFERAR